jgi:hypothetical protein
MSADTWLASAAIGAAASLGGMILAFRRGFIGVVVNFVAGIGGALIGGALAQAASPQRTFGGPAIPGIPAPAGPSPLFLSGVGAIGALVLLHLVWALRLTRRGQQAPAR